jgi:hypothetical protein
MDDIYGLHSWHGFLPAAIASSLVAYRTRFFTYAVQDSCDTTIWLAHPRQLQIVSGNASTN